jgi:hypothetical protein
MLGRVEDSLADSPACAVLDSACAPAKRSPIAASTPLRSTVSNCFLRWPLTLPIEHAESALQNPPSHAPNDSGRPTTRLSWAAVPSPNSSLLFDSR